MAKNPNFAARKAGASAALVGGTTAAGAAIGKAVSGHEQVTRMTNVPNVYGEGPGTMVPHIVDVATSAAHQLHGTKVGAALGLAAGAATVYGLHRAMSPRQFGKK